MKDELILDIITFKIFSLKSQVFLIPFLQHLEAQETHSEPQYVIQRHFLNTS